MIGGGRRPAPDPGVGVAAGTATASCFAGVSVGDWVGDDEVSVGEGVGGVDVDPSGVWVDSTGGIAVAVDNGWVAASVGD